MTKKKTRKKTKMAIAKVFALHTNARKLYQMLMII